MGKIPFSVLYSRQLNYEKVKKLSVKMASQKYLYFRGGVGKKLPLDKVAIVGCGSIGSVIAQILFESGISDFVLLDKENLEIDNIARHLCGFQYVNRSKCDALGDLFKKHNPNVHFESINENALNALDELEFDGISMLVIAVGTLSIEYLVMEKVRTGQIRCPVLIVWVEPYLIGGQAILLMKPQNAFPRLFNEDLSFKYSVGMNNHICAKRVSGCQSTFIQYAFIEVKHFLYSLFAEKVFPLIESGVSNNYSITWVGSRSEGLNRGIIFSDKYNDSDKNKLIVRRIG
jgi:hypothetical protein